ALPISLPGLGDGIDAQQSRVRPIPVRLFGDEVDFSGIDPPISYPQLVHEDVAVEAHQFEEDPVELIVPGSHRSPFLLFLELPDLRSGRWWDLLLALDPQCGHQLDRKSTRLNSSHVSISYAVFCSRKKNTWRHSKHLNV